MNIQIKQIPQINILSSTFTLAWDKTSNGGYFSFSSGQIKIGIKDIKKDPIYVLSVISHEVMEIILVSMGARFDNERTGENYLFNFDHQTFENAIQIHTEIMQKFTK